MSETVKTKASINTVNIYIDGAELAVPEKSLLLDAALNAGIKIPHLCYCPGLESVGACRICLVEIEGERKLITSCTRKVKEGMVVHTDTEKVRNARRFVTELILSNHPGDCLSCDKNGHCELQQCAYGLGIEGTRFSMKRSGYEADIDDFITRNYDLCILCGRCIRACNVYGNGVLDFMRRGMVTKVTTPLDKPLRDTECSFCGSCISVCPVAALMESDRKFKGQEWELTKKNTVCSYCGCGCELVVSTLDNAIVKAESANKTDYICARGKFGWDYIVHQDRLRTPLVKKSGKLVAATWDEALDLVTKNLSNIKKKHGSDSLGGIVGAGLSNETLYLFQKLFRVALGTNNVDGPARLYGPNLIPSPLDVLGVDSLATLTDIEESDVLLLMGVNVTDDYPHIGAMVKRAMSRGAKIITVDPRSTKIAKLSHMHLQVDFGSEGTLLNLMARVMLDEGLFDQKSISKIKNFDGFKGCLNRLGKKEIESVGVAKEQVEEATRLYANKAVKSTLIFPAEMNDNYMIQAIRNLLILSGRTTGAVFPCILLNNLWGSVAMGVMPELLPGALSIEDEKAQKKINDLYGVVLPKKSGISGLDMVRKGSPIKGMYILGDDPLLHFPNWKEAEKTLASMEFLAVQTIFPSKITGIADVVLPATSLMEESGTFFSADGQLKQANPVIANTARSNGEILAEISAGLGYPLPYEDVTEIRDEIERFSPGVFDGWRKRGKGKELLFTLDEPDGTYERASSKYPFRLMIGGTSFAFHTGSMSGRSKLAILESGEEGFVAMNSQDIEKMGLQEGSKVKVSSPVASLTAELKSDDELPLGLLFMPGWFAQAHSLRSSETAKGSLKYCSTAVSVEKEKKGR